MSVKDLLASHTSYELTEWEAYERVYGFTDPKLYDLLAAIHEEVQLTNHLLGGAHFTEEGGENPVPAPTRLPRPGERLPVEEDEEK
jgi:hypothetical protein